MTKIKHIHKLRRHTYESGNKMFFCTLPDCNYKVRIGLALGKRSICNRCSNDFIMNEYSIRLAKPHCDECHKIKDKDKHIMNSNMMGNIRDFDEPIEPMSLAERLDKLSNRNDEEI